MNSALCEPPIAPESASTDQRFQARSARTSRANASRIGPGCKEILRAGIVPIERIRVQHQKFPAPDQPAARARLVAEFRLYLIGEQRQLFIGPNIVLA